MGKRTIVSSVNHKGQTKMSFMQKNKMHLFLIIGTINAKIHPNYNIILGKYSYVKKINVIGGHANLIIGKFCSIAPNLTVILSSEHKPENISTYSFNQLNLANVFHSDAKAKGDVTIGNDVWIGINVTIMSGVTIGDGAIIGAGSIVTNDVPPYAIVAGNPAQKIKMRFTDETIAKLLEIQWWNWDIEKINQNIPFLHSTNIELFLSNASSNLKK
jgi:acetyltransferase-like isoleucine patch superfamily enzyme